MAGVVVVGSQWGDEGKGKFVDYLASKADIVARFQGGHNAGHTLVIDGVTYKLNILPSGVVRKNAISVIGNGAVLSIEALLNELKGLAELGIELTPERLWIAENICLVLPAHQELDGLREKAAGDKSLGTTLRGIGPAYEDKVGRRAVRLMDLANEAELRARLERMAAHHNPLRVSLGAGPIDIDALVAGLLEQYEKIHAFQKPAWILLNQATKAGKKILFEGGQGVQLDIDHGTYPFVTSSNTVAGQAAAGVGLGPRAIGYVLGITKAYTTRVGAGAFPTELEDETGQHLGKRGKEFGTTTGRKRRCGWFDATLVRQSVMVAGLDGLAITKLDVLDELAEIKIATGYRLKGEVLDHLPASAFEQAEAEPIYETLPGWQSSTLGITNLEDLPEAARTYLDRIRALVGAEIAFVSTGAEREHTITVSDPLDKI